jgi:hypothetical protein
LSARQRPGPSFRGAQRRGISPSAAFSRSLIPQASPECFCGVARAGAASAASNDAASAANNGAGDLRLFRPSFPRTPAAVFRPRHRCIQAERGARWRCRRGEP